MRLLTSLLLGALALLLVVALLLQRVGRFGGPRWTAALLTSLVRHLAIALVAIGASRAEAEGTSPVEGERDATPTGAARDGELTPPDALFRPLDGGAAFEWRTRHERMSATLRRAKQHLLRASGEPRVRVGLPWWEPPQHPAPAMVQLLGEALAARSECAPEWASPASLATLSSALDEVEAAGVFDPWVVSFLWRQARQAGAATEPPLELPSFYGRLRRHARIAGAVRQSLALLRDAAPRPWMSKAMPTEEDLLAEAEERARYQKDYRRTVEAQLRRADAGTWDSDATVELASAAASGRVVLHRAGKLRLLESGERFRLGRLDLLEALPGSEAPRLAHDWLGPVELPVGRLVSVWDLPSGLTAQGNAELDRTLLAAREGDLPAADRLGAALPLAHERLRRTLERGVALPPDTCSAASLGRTRLRFLLGLFDESVFWSSEPCAR